MHLSNIIENILKSILLSIIAISTLAFFNEKINQYESIAASNMTYHHQEIIKPMIPHQLSVDQFYVNVIESYMTNVFNQPVNYSKIVARAIVNESSVMNIDAFLVASIIGAESSFNSHAESNVGAQGLMQVMPFWKVEKRMGFNHKNHDLKDIYLNIKYGCAILSRYTKHYQTTNKALAAYNGSKGSMKYPLKVGQQWNSLRAYSMKSIFNQEG